MCLQGFFNSLRIELSDFPNILISTVLPGPVQSKIIHNAFQEEVNMVKKKNRVSDCSYKWWEEKRFLPVRLFGLVASDCNGTREPGLQDADQPLRASDAGRDGEQREGDVDLAAALPPVFLPVAVHPHAGLAHLRHTGQKANPKFQIWAGVYTVVLIDSHIVEWGKFSPEPASLGVSGKKKNKKKMYFSLLPCLFIW